MYKKIDASDVTFLKSVLSEDRVQVGDEILSDYSHDELGGTENPPEVLLFPLTTEEISKVMAYANKHRIPVTTRGAGTGLVGSSVAVHGGIMISMTRMDKILELDKKNLTVTIQPGVLLMTLAAFAEENDLFYPPDPGEKTATVGGNISTNAGGMRAVRYGVTRDYVRALKVVLPSGEVVDLGGKVVKNSSGYSLLNLMVGSEGTLGIITEATMKLIPKPAKSMSLLVPYKTMETALDTVPNLVASGLNLTAIEYFSRDVVLFAEDFLAKKFPDTTHDAYLLLTFDGRTTQDVEAGYSAAADICLENGAVDAYFVDTEERYKSVWSSRSAFLEAIKASTSEMDECDVVVPRSRIADFIKYTHEIAAKLNVRIPSFGHAGDGNLHIYICRDELDRETFEEKLKEAFRLMYDKAAEFGGLVSGEHGIGYAKRQYLAESLGPVQINLMRGIKDAFDPNHILNPDKVFAL